MAISQVSGSKGTIANANRIRFSVPYSNQFKPGDFIFVFTEQDGVTSAFTAPAGWTQIGATLTGASAAIETLWQHQINDREPGGNSDWFTIPATEFNAASYIGYTGVDYANPLDVAPVSATFNASASCAIPLITTVTDNAMIVVFEGEQDIGASHTGPGTEEADISSISLYDYVQVVHGNTPVNTVTLSASSGGGGYAIALRPLATQRPSINADQSTFPKVAPR